jgi:hypothetical protein
MIDINSPSVADAASLANFDRPSSDISNASFQSALQESLVAEGESVPLSSIDIDGTADERVQEEWPNEQADFAEQSADDSEQEPANQNLTEQYEEMVEENEILDAAEQSLQEQENQPPHELTPAELNAGIQQLGERAEQLGMNDAASAQQLAYELTAPFGAAPNTIDSQVLGSVMSKTVLSALDIYTANGGNLEGLGAIPPAAAQAFTSDLLSAMHVDPRMASVDSNALASLVLGATLNVVDTVNRYGLDARVEQFNAPEVAEFFVSNLYRVFGVDAPVNRAEALHIADSFAKYVQSGLRQASARIGPQQRTQQQRTPRRSSARRTFESNNDIFGDTEVLERIRMERL